MILDNKCKTEWRSVCGKADVLVPLSSPDVVTSDDESWEEAYRRLDAAFIRAERMGVSISYKNDFPPLQDRYTPGRVCGAEFNTSMVIQTNDTHPLDRVFARIKDEYGVDIVFTEDMPFEKPSHAVYNGGSEDTDPHWSFRSTVPKEEKPPTFDEHWFGVIKDRVARDTQRMIDRGLLVQPSTGEALDRLAEIPVPVPDERVSGWGENLAVRGLEHGQDAKWACDLYEALEEIPGVTVEKMDVDFEKEKMHLVLDHPDKRLVVSDKHPRVSWKIDASMVEHAPEWAQKAFDPLSGDLCAGWCPSDDNAGGFNGRVAWDWSAKKPEAAKPEAAYPEMCAALEAIPGVEEARVIESGRGVLRVSVSPPKEAASLDIAHTIAEHRWNWHLTQK